MVDYSCLPSTQEAEIGGLHVHGLPRLILRHFLKTNNQTNDKNNNQTRQKIGGVESSNHIESLVRIVEQDCCSKKRP